MEILANLCESVLWIVFLKIFCLQKHGKKVDFLGAVTAVFLLMACIGLSDRSTFFSHYTVLIDFAITFGYTMLFLQSELCKKVTLKPFQGFKNVITSSRLFPLLTYASIMVSASC